MEFALSDQARAAGYRLSAYDAIGSTSAEAMSCARGGDPGPLWIVARQQSAGTGRRGSAWQTPPGNLAASLLLRTDLPPAILAQLGFVAGLALAWALEACWERDPGTPSPLAGEGGLRVSGGRRRGETSVLRVGVDSAATRFLPQGETASARFRLKWPNDVLADGAKLAGILLQTEQLAEARAVVIGIGVNVVHAPEGLPYPATSLRGLGCETDAPSLFGALAGAWLDAHALWNEGRGFEAIRKSWLARAAGLGGPIRVVVGGTAARGTFESIDEHGQLLLRGADGSIRRVSAGDVHLGEAASALSEAASPRGEEAA